MILKKYYGYLYKFLCVAIICFVFSACKKLVSVKPPKDFIASSHLFQSERQAESALIGVYSDMINGKGLNAHQGAGSNYSAGLMTIAGSIGSGEMLNLADAAKPLYAINLDNALNLWDSAYRTVYLANVLITGMENETSGDFNSQVRTQYLAEGRFLRAFAYYYLVSLFGDIPLVLTSSSHASRSLTRSPSSQVYTQIIRDLSYAFDNLKEDFSVGNGQRIRVNKWAAASMLSRVYLTLNDFEKASYYSTLVIERSDLFDLVALSDVFLANNKESIFQLAQTTENSDLRNATPEGYAIWPLNSTISSSSLTPNMLSRFEYGDRRNNIWIHQFEDAESEGGVVSIPAKYKVGRHNSILMAPAEEYYVVLRLAEQYLIRAEARIQGVNGGVKHGVEDLNVIRRRAGLPDLPLELTKEKALDALWKERETELFAEWGHRWFDLIRSGRASSFLSKLPQFQPWDGDWQLLYPIPEVEINVNPRLTQNPGYNEIRRN